MILIWLVIAGEKLAESAQSASSAFQVLNFTPKRFHLNA